MRNFEIRTQEGGRFDVKARSWNDAVAYVEDRHGEQILSVELVQPEGRTFYSEEWDEQMVTVEELTSLAVKLAEMIGKHRTRVEAQHETSHQRHYTAQLLEAQSSLAEAKRALEWGIGELNA